MSDRSTLAEQASVRTTAPGALDQREGRSTITTATIMTTTMRMATIIAMASTGPKRPHCFRRALRGGGVVQALGAVLCGERDRHRGPRLSAGWPILKEAFENVLERRMTMELSMTIAIVAAAAIGQFFTALIITLFVLVAEVLEGLTVGRGRKAIRDLLEFLPREVSVRRSGAIQRHFRRRAAYRRCHSGCSWRPYSGGRDGAVGSLFRG